MKRKSKLLIVSIPIIIILAMFLVYEYGVVNVYRHAEDLQDQRDTKMKLLGKYAALIAEKPALEKRMAELKEARKNADAKMMAAQTAAIASANLQSAVKGIITARNGVINSERMEKAEDAGKHKMISVTVDALFPDIGALSDALLTIETQTPYLVVKEVDVRVRNMNDPRELIVKLKVAALTGP